MFKRIFGFAKDLVKSFLGNNCAMHAAGLTYYSMLAMVPVLCLLLLAAKTMGAKELLKTQIEDKFNSAISKIEAPPEEDVAILAPVLGEEGEEKAVEKRKCTEEFVGQARDYKNQLLERIDQFDVSTVGWIGLALLAWSVLNSIGMVEVSFNEIWEVGARRPVWRRLLVSVAVILILPLLSGLAMAVPLMKIAKDVIIATAGRIWLTKWISDGFIWVLDLWVVRMAVTLFFSSIAFGFVFWLVPFCKTRWKYAWWSGFVTSFLFTAWLKICTVAQIGIAKTSAVYGSFAFLPIVLAWLYMSWQILLFGCCIAKTAQARGGRKKTGASAAGGTPDEA